MLPLLQLLQLQPMGNRTAPIWWQVGGQTWSMAAAATAAPAAATRPCRPWNTPATFIEKGWILYFNIYWLQRCRFRDRGSHESLNKSTSYCLKETFVWKLKSSCRFLRQEQTHWAFDEWGLGCCTMTQVQIPHRTSRQVGKNQQKGLLCLFKTVLLFSETSGPSRVNRDWEGFFVH